MNGKLQEEKSSDTRPSLDELQRPPDVIRAVARRTFTVLKQEPTQTQDDLAGHVVKYVLRNYRNNVTLEGIAREVGLSKFYLLRRFRCMTGITPGAFLKRVRLVKAMDLLVESKLQIKQIAHAVGYSHVPAFCRAFRSATGTHPRIYRLTRPEAVEAKPNDVAEGLDQPGEKLGAFGAEG
jgi:AraC-like DNA-binding protein